jgi:hypothetical protein
VREALFDVHGAELTSAAEVRALREFLKEHSDPAPEIIKDSLNQRTVVRTRGNLIVTLLELEHR